MTMPSFIFVQAKNAHKNTWVKSVKWPKKVGRSPKVGKKVGREIRVKFGRFWSKIGLFSLFLVLFSPFWGLLRKFTDEFCGWKMVCGQKPTFIYYYYKEKIKNIYNWQKYLGIWVFPIIWFVFIGWWLFAPSINI